MRSNGGGGGGILGKDVCLAFPGQLQPVTTPAFSVEMGTPGEWVGGRPNNQPITEQWTTTLNELNELIREAKQKVKESPVVQCHCVVRPRE